MELLYATEVRLGLVTNGEQGVLVHARRGETSAFCSWYASLWAEEPLTLRRLHAEMDQAVAASQGWEDLDLEHGFHKTK